VQQQGGAAGENAAHDISSKGRQKSYDNIAVQWAIRCWCCVVIILANPC
jgi:hypothetical protein